MRLLVSEPAARLIGSRGGRLYVWPKKARCCGGLTTLATSTEPGPGREFRSAASLDGVELFVPATLAPLPDELHVELHRFPRRVEAYWNGCAWVN